MNLHELPGIIRKAEPDEIIYRDKGDPEGTQFFLPVPPEGTDDGSDVILINGGILITDLPDISAFFQVQTDLLLVGKGYLGIGNDLI